jgi:protocatechuate 3,4-dioxygenase alpha subunit
VSLTPSQTVGPFFSHALVWPDGADVVPDGAAGAFWLRGQVFDGAGAPVADALIETWQVPTGHRGFGRVPTDVDGRWAVRTVRPGRVPAPDGRLQAPHVAVSVFGPGLLDRVVTRIYFPDEPSNMDDPVLSDLPEPRRSTLIARATDDGFAFDVRLQGERETVFFDI